MTTVFVWQNHFVDLSGGAKWTGHASMSITDNYVDTRPLVPSEDRLKMVVDTDNEKLVDGKDDYVSFWSGAAKNDPNNKLTFHDGWRFGVKFMAQSMPSMFADVAFENYAPDHVIRINGLSETKMIAEWQSIRKKKEASYRFYRKNCSTIVARVLRAAAPWYKSSHHLVWTPCDVRDFAFNLGTAMLWADFIDELEGKKLGTTEQLDVLRRVKRRSAARGTSGGEARHP